MASLLRGWERYSFAGPEPIAVAIDPILDVVKF